MSRILFGGCGLFMLSDPAIAATPMNYFQPAGSVADEVAQLGWGLGLLSLLVVLIIAVLLLVAIFRRRQYSPPDEHGLPTVSRPHSGLRGVYLGTGITVVVLIAAAVWIFSTLASVDRQVNVEPAFSVNVTTLKVKVTTLKVKVINESIKALQGHPHSPAS